MKKSTYRTPSEDFPQQRNNNSLMHQQQRVPSQQQYKRRNEDFFRNNNNDQYHHRNNSDNGNKTELQVQALSQKNQRLAKELVSNVHVLLIDRLHSKCILGVFIFSNGVLCPCDYLFIMIMLCSS